MTVEEQAAKDAADKEAEDAAKKSEPKFTQEDIDRIVGDFKKSEKAKAEQEKIRLAKEAEDAALVKNGEFQKLAEEHKKQAEAAEARAKALETALEAARKDQEDMDAAIKADNDAELKSRNASPAIIEALDGKTPRQVREWLVKHRDGLGVTPVKGPPKNPGPNGGKEGDDAINKKREDAVKRQYTHL